MVAAASETDPAHIDTVPQQTGKNSGLGAIGTATVPIGRRPRIPRRTALIATAATALVVVAAVVLAEGTGSDTGHRPQADGIPNHPVTASDGALSLGDVAAGHAGSGDATSSSGAPASVSVSSPGKNPASTSLAAPTTAQTTAARASGSGGGVATTTHPAPAPHTTPAGSPPGTPGGINMNITGNCFGYCADLPVRVTWNGSSGATSYTLHYTISNKSVDNTVNGLTDPSGGYVVHGTSSADNLCVQLRAVNRYGSSSWTGWTCYTVPM